MIDELKARIDKLAAKMYDGSGQFSLEDERRLHRLRVQLCRMKVADRRRLERESNERHGQRHGRGGAAPEPGKA